MNSSAAVFKETLQRSRRIAAAAVFLALSTALTQSSFAQAAPAQSIAYSVDLASPEQHLVNVQIILPAGAAQRELQLPVWNALYQIRDFAQYVNWVRAKNRSGDPLPVHELDKSRWQIQGAEGGAIVEYQIYVDAPGPFGAQLNSHHAFFNLAEILMYPVDARTGPFKVRFGHVPEGWRIATPLTQASDAEFSAANYDRLVDSPVEIGTFVESDFDEAAAHFRVIVDADPADYDMAKIVAALHKIVLAATTWMNDRPFDTYTFIYHFPRGPAGGGMEHAYATAIDLNADSIKQSLNALTGVTSHEFFHLWNVKRIRPQTLEPVDYTKENYTRALWFSEGVTSTAEGIIELRAGLLDEKHYLDQLSEEITELERRPAHLTQSAEESSLDAWLEGNPYYRRPERSISYYNKGELLGVVLDLKVREASHGDLASFFAKYVAGTEEIPWDDFFRQVGLRVDTISNNIPDAGFIASRNFDGPMSVAAVTPGGDAERAGLQVGDTIIELQGKPVGQESRQTLIELNSGDTLIVKVRSRRAGERELKWKVGTRQEISYELRDLDQVTPAQRERRTAWLKGEAQSAPDASSPGAPAGSAPDPVTSGVSHK